MKKLLAFSIGLLTIALTVATGIPVLFAAPMSTVLGTAADVAALTSYAGTYKKELIATMINGIDVKNDIMVMPVGKNGETLTKLKVKDGLRRFSSTTEFDSGDLKYTPRAINVKLAKRELLINPKDYYKTYLAQALAGGSGGSNKQIPFDQYTWDRVLKQVGSEVNDKIAYFGLDIAALTVVAFGAGGFTAGQYVTFGTPTRWYRCVTNAADGESPATHPAKWLDVTAHVIVKGFGVVIAAEVTATTIAPVAPNLSINRFILSFNSAGTANGTTPATFYTKAIAADFLFNRFNDTDESNFRTGFNTYILPTIGTKRIQNAFHCWFSEGRAIYHAGSNKTWIGQVHGPSNANYYQYIFELNNTTGVITKFQLGTRSEKDDHNEPSILIRASDSKLFACYTEHALAGSPIRYRISTNALDASAWGSELTKDPDGAGNHTFTYATCYQVTNGDIYIFYRDTDLVAARWSYIKSTDNGVTFGSQNYFFDKPYLNSFQDPNNANLIHFAGSMHPNEFTTPNTVGHFYFNAGAGTWHKSDGTNVTANLPLTDPNVTAIFTNTHPDQGWIEDIMVDGSGYPRVLMTYYPDVVATPILKFLYYSEWNGSAWSTPYEVHQSVNKNMGVQTLVNTYPPLATFDRGDINRIFCGKQVGTGNTEIFMLTRLSASSFTSEQKTSNSGHDQWRPFTVASPVNNVFWTDKVYYDTYLTTLREDLRYATY